MISLSQVPRGIEPRSWFPIPQNWDRCRCYTIHNEMKNYLEKRNLQSMNSKYDQLTRSRAFIISSLIVICLESPPKCGSRLRIESSNSIAIIALLIILWSITKPFWFPSIRKGRISVKRFERTFDMIFYDTLHKLIRRMSDGYLIGFLFYSK